MMPQTNWTDARLTRLFERYRRRYWPTSRRLTRYRVRVGVKDTRAMGWCDFEQRVLFVDPASCSSDRHVRATLLHEMIHAVVGREGQGHDAPFWAQLEYLLSRRAPITVGFPELGEQGQHYHIIPRRFRRCRRMFRPVYERHRRAVEKRISGFPSIVITPAAVERECEDLAAIEGVMWRDLWTQVAADYGWVDLDGRICTWAEPYAQAARRGYQRGRRWWLEEKRTDNPYAAMQQFCETADEVRGLVRETRKMINAGGPDAEQLVNDLAPLMPDLRRVQANVEQLAADVGVTRSTPQ